MSHQCPIEFKRGESITKSCSSLILSHDGARKTQRDRMHWVQFDWGPLSLTLSHQDATNRHLHTDIKSLIVSNSLGGFEREKKHRSGDEVEWCCVNLFMIQEIMTMSLLCRSSRVFAFFCYGGGSVLFRGKDPGGLDEDPKRSSCQCLRGIGECISQLYM